MHVLLLGDLIIIMAQVVVAAQMVYEEKYVKKHNVPPLQAVGWEGGSKSLFYMTRFNMCHHSNVNF